MIVDLHSHYPMHVLAGEPSSIQWMLKLHRRSLRDIIRTLILRFANWVGNYPEPGMEPAVTIERLKASNVRVALSVLHAPFAEMDLSERYGAPPRAEYFAELVKQIEAVEQSLTGHEADVTVAHNPAELHGALAANKIALVHAVEGGFHLGDTDAAIQTSVAELAGRGAAYITVAHLFWRQVATNAPGIPFLPDWLYRTVFPQPARGLGELGCAVVRAMVANHILIDVTHMSERCIDETLQLLAQLDPDGTVPLVATHSACRFGRVEYNLKDEHIAAIAGRRGVVGLIACTHWMADGLKEPQSAVETVDILCRHIDRIAKVTGSHEFTAIGTDQDGFIKPALRGLELPGGFRQVEAALKRRYGDQVADRICSGNALRVLQYWKGGTSPASKAG